MAKYEPSGQLSLLGWLLLPVVAVGGGLILGIIVSLVSQLIYLIILFPILMGAAGGGIIVVAMVSGKVRNRIVGAFFAILIALVMYSTLHFTQYRFSFRDDLRQEVEDRYKEKLSDDEYIRLEDALLKKLTGSTGFIGYIKLSAQEGITITKVGMPSSGTGAVLKGMGAYIYWLVEWLIITGIAISMACGQAKKPFCEETGEWFGTPVYAGTVLPDKMQMCLEALQMGSMAQAGACVVLEALPSTPRIEMVVQRPPSPASEVVVTIRTLTKDNRGRISTQDKLQGLISVGSFEEMKKAIQVSA